MRQFINLTVLILAVVLAPGFLYGQRTITGVVTDAVSGETLIGANILVVGTVEGTITDVDGSYSLKVPEGATRLVFSYTGYNSQEVAIGSSDKLDIRLVAGQVLDEVVVIGYGTVKREDATGSVQTV
ncbi:MAG: carboxypeptidase-like regulatory domain-containing protein, partial [Saprospiraceae bacterium]|nr:carboxypeptidase-like regulatory domain-containing protein [Saprospiraceae bacterium]